MRIAVTGGAGAIGSLVAARLAGQGFDVVAVVRDPTRARAPGVRAARADYADRAALQVALAGSDRLVFVGSDGEADRMLVHHRNILDAARAAGVERVVLLGSQDADPGSPFCYAHTYAITEEWLPEACPQPVVVRANLYAEFFGRWVRHAAQVGELALPIGSGAVAPIARRDVAEALAAVVVAPDPPSRMPVLTGPEAYGHDGLALVAGSLGERPVRSRPCTREEFARRLVGTEPSPWWRYAFSTLFEAIAAGAFATCTDDVLRLTGRPPQQFTSALQALRDPA